ncbi:AGE family epimerase/isomerase [Aestuariivirga sp.]|uniref:AGE family epimerase/isomerase n=1 Tax=Aestuariivirga sp. TaxID=2650926 RepID=UPI003BAB9459
MTDLNWTARPWHRDWLKRQATALFDLFQNNAVNPKGGFFDLDAAGKPFGNTRQIHATARMVHCFAIAAKLGRPGAATIVDHGMDYLWNGHRDRAHGGYCWSLDDTGFKDDSKQAYGHAFVLLAAADARMLGHPLADGMLADITQILESRFWEEAHGAVSEEYARDWSPITTYRGQNSNMHLTEALMAAFEATGEARYLDMAKRIASLIIARHAASLDYVVAEHFDAGWNIDTSYKGSDMFRPAGTTPGHWLEWARLLAQLWVLDGRKEAWHIEAAEKLFRSAVTRGWDYEKGGFFYTLDFEHRPALTHKIWWPLTEAIGAAAFLNALTPAPFYESWYRKLWDFAATHFIDPANGGWFGELDDDLLPMDKFFTGKPDIYHALQACLIPLFPPAGSLMRAVEA